MRLAIPLFALLAGCADSGVFIDYNYLPADVLSVVITVDDGIGDDITRSRFEGLGIDDDGDGYATVSVLSEADRLPVDIDGYVLAEESVDALSLCQAGEIDVHVARVNGGEGVDVVVSQMTPDDEHISCWFSVERDK